MDGIVGDLSVRDNIILAAQVLRGFFRPFSKAQANKFADEYIKLLEIKTASADTPIKSLSGGNQQKVILGRWLLTDPDILLLDEPTRGIDVGAKFEIYQLINQLAEQGKGIIVVSSEMPELFGISDRILVMSNGHQSAIFDSKEVGQVDVMQAAARFI